MTSSSQPRRNGLPDTPARRAAFAEIERLESLRGLEISAEDRAGLEVWLREGGYAAAVERMVVEDPDLAI
jgi:hypothetical protein